MKLWLEERLKNSNRHGAWRHAGGNVVERLTLDLNVWREIWPEDAAPALVITIGEEVEA